MVSKLAFLFPGQGSQHAGMGRALAEAYPECRELFELSDEALGTSLSKICFEGSESDLAKTEQTQPAVLTVSVAALRALELRGLRADAAAGHSLGEYTAHVGAGTLAFSDAVRVVRQRGRFMQEAVAPGQGAMAAILGLDRETVERVCREAADGQVVSVANLNGPDQIVIAGAVEAVARAVGMARDAGAKRAVPLPVSAPFHCSLMAPAADRLVLVLETVPFSDPKVPVYANADALPVRTGREARAALARQVCSPVRWQEVVEAMVESGVDMFVEVGPGKVLTGLVRRIRSDVRVLSVSDPEGVEAAVRELA